LKEPTRTITIGILQNVLILFGFAIVYNIFLRHLVVRYEWAECTIGEFWFFLLLMLISPAINILRKKKYLVIGNFLGIAFYFVILSLVFGIFGN